MQLAITGATGTLGRACIDLAVARGHSVVAVARGEDRMAALQADHPDVRCLMGDVRDVARMMAATKGADAIIHCAALKRVEMYEDDPGPAVDINIQGTAAIIRAARDARVVTVSTDKAVEPTSLYGLTKATAERLTWAAGGQVVRLGNIYRSTGSVPLLWDRQVAAGQPLTITDPSMTRFFVRRDEAAALCIDALDSAQPLVLPHEMMATDVGTLVEALHPESMWDVIGPRPGERLHETIATEDEAERCGLTRRRSDAPPQRRVWEVREWCA